MISSFSRCSGDEAVHSRWTAWNGREFLQMSKIFGAPSIDRSNYPVLMNSRIGSVAHSNVFDAIKWWRNVMKMKCTWFCCPIFIEIFICFRFTLTSSIVYSTYVQWKIIIDSHNSNIVERINQIIRKRKILRMYTYVYIHIDVCRWCERIQLNMQ